MMAAWLTSDKFEDVIQGVTVLNPLKFERLKAWVTTRPVELTATMAKREKSGSLKALTRAGPPLVTTPMRK